MWIVLGEEEVRKALSKMKKGKAVGSDDIPVEAWRKRCNLADGNPVPRNGLRENA